MILLERLSKEFGTVKAVDEICLEVAPGEILGFLGPNGAGKTTTVKMLVGILKPTRGSAEVAGFDVGKQPVEVKKRVGYVPESGALFESLTAREYLELVSELHHLDRAKTGQRIEELLRLFELHAEMDQQLSRFSKGMKQKVLLAAALIHNPEVLFLDEPLNGLDANAALVVKSLLRKLAAQGKTIMFCSHVLEVVERLCTRLAVIDHGRIIALGTISEILEQTSQASLESAFGYLTDARDHDASSDEFLETIARS